MVAKRRLLAVDRCLHGPANTEPGFSTMTVDCTLLTYAPLSKTEYTLALLYLNLASLPDLNRINMPIFDTGITYIAHVTCQLRPGV
jgi:hypothetical protein